MRLEILKPTFMELKPVFDHQSPVEIFPDPVVGTGGFLGNPIWALTV